MPSQTIRLFIILVCFVSAPFVVVPAELSLEIEIEALKAFKNSITDDPFGALADWTDANHHCNWSGIACHPPSNHVISISLVRKNLRGKISPFLGNVTSLKVLDLTSNSFTGHIPTQLGHCSQLLELTLYGNSLFGPIPAELGNLGNLQSLDFSSNLLKGKIPESMCNWTSLRKLDASLNKLNGTIPTGIGNLANLQSLDLSKNQLSGDIPREIGNLSNLESLQLFENKLSGKFPSEIVLCKRLVTLSVFWNSITGIIPLNICSLQNLEILYLGFNELNGSIPSCLSNCTHLVQIDLCMNRLIGKIPQGLGKLQNLTSLILGDNNMSGELPDDLFNCSNLNRLVISLNGFEGMLRPGLGKLINLQFLQAGGNSLAGPIPREIGNLTQLICLDLSTNNFSGLVPPELSKLSLLQGLFLHDNMLEGAILEKLFDLTRLTDLELQNNRFIGAIPDALSNLKLLLGLHLNGNMLNGSIPKSIAYLSGLMSLDLSHNHLTGSIPGSVIAGMRSMQLYLNLSYNLLTGAIPNELGMLEMVQTIDISNNKLSGIIPETVGGCKNLFSLDISTNELSGEIQENFFTQMILLTRLNLSRNLFNGGLPKSLGNLKHLVSLDLSHNRFYGLIPESFGSLSSLKTLNLSFNKLEGPIPKTGIFRNISISSFAGNLDLCGAAFLHNCSKQTAWHSFSKKIAIIFLAFGAAFLVIVSLIKYITVHKKQGAVNLEPEYISALDLKRFDHKDLEMATNIFSEENIIGASNLSTVYKGKLDNGQIIAVKKLNLHQFSSKCFNREINALSQLKHRNLARVLGYAWESGKLKALVLEYMENGNLESVIHEPYTDHSRWTLSERINVFASIASALDYLHSGYHVPIVHCDLKPSNILLDGDWEVHVSDFGTARVLAVHLHNGSSGLAFEGTIGYLPPEFAYMRKVTTKVDVFSFGIIVMEFLTKRRPIGLTQEDGLPITLHQLVEISLQCGRNRLLEIVDLDLASSIFDEKHVEIIEELLQLALSCTCPEPEERPHMCEVLSFLLKLKAACCRNVYAKGFLKLQLSPFNSQHSHGEG
ncbi:LRR receptor-like serine/threonine-protein kinase FLS2 [Malania oleifera]|uniref:LRR receptor-like serine/threonine-protein kinase FLS2 n=1 Tax=Malania oleifera TaxID=397392 RepID=UPI0025AE37B3|nr:LRR receptor-like serine/threonine-protein kinase FLS2 [Malania oleifera]